MSLLLLRLESGFRLPEERLQQCHAIGCLTQRAHFHSSHQDKGSSIGRARPVGYPSLWLADHSLRPTWTQVEKKADRTVAEAESAAELAYLQAISIRAASGCPELRF